MINIHDIWNHLLVELNEADLVKLLKQLNIDFTQKRKNLDRYVMDEKLVSAYSAFYLPTNIPKFSFLMDQLEPEMKDEISMTHLIDFGSGPGTFSLAFLDYFNGGNEKITLIDQSNFMLKQARKLIQNLYPNIKVSYDKSISKPQGKRTLLFGHSFNEVGYEQAKEIIDRVDPDFMILIEPGTKEVFSYINDLRLLMKEKKYSCLYPCPTLDGDCPMALREDDWCHGVLKLTHHPDLERLSQIIKRDRRTMPNIMHVYKKGRRLNQETFRLVRFLKNTKFSFELEVCLQQDGLPKIVQIQIPKKSIPKKKIKEFEKINVGQALNIQIVKKFEAFWRAEFID